MQLDAAPAVVDQRGQPATDAQVDAHPLLGCVLGVHVVALFIGHHLERQLVVVAQEEGPLASSGISGVCSMISMIG